MQLTYVILSGLSLLNIGAHGATITKTLSPPHSNEAHQARRIVHRRQFHNADFGLTPEGKHVRQATRHYAGDLPPLGNPISGNNPQVPPSTSTIPPADKPKNDPPNPSDPNNIPLLNKPATSPSSTNPLDSASHVADSTAKNKVAPMTSDVAQGHSVSAATPGSAFLLLNPGRAKKSVTDDSVSKSQNGETASGPLDLLQPVDELGSILDPLFSLLGLGGSSSSAQEPSLPAGVKVGPSAQSSPEPSSLPAGGQGGPGQSSLPVDLDGESLPSNQESSLPVRLKVEPGQQGNSESSPSSPAKEGQSAPPPPPPPQGGPPPAKEGESAPSSSSLAEGGPMPAKEGQSAPPPPPPSSPAYGAPPPPVKEGESGPSSSSPAQVGPMPPKEGQSAPPPPPPSSPAQGGPPPAKQGESGPSSSSPAQGGPMPPKEGQSAPPPPPPSSPAQGGPPPAKQGESGPSSSSPPPVAGSMGESSSSSAGGQGGRTYPVVGAPDHPWSQSSSPFNIGRPADPLGCSCQSPSKLQTHDTEEVQDVSDALDSVVH